MSSNSLDPKIFSQETMSQASPRCLPDGAVPDFGDAVCTVQIFSPNQTITERLTSCCGSAPVQFAGNSTDTVPVEQSCITYCAYEPWVNATDFATASRAGTRWRDCVQGTSLSSSSSSTGLYTSCQGGNRLSQTGTSNSNSNDASRVSKSISIYAALTVALTVLMLAQSA
jgi:hypothetical protein